MKINELIDGIRKSDLVLPEFQREYVWTHEQSKQLIVSLLKHYPVGGLLFWKTDNPPELKNVTQLPERLGTIEVILDGQQRLTTLYMLVTGEIPPYYTEQDLKYDPRNLYFNIAEGDFQYYQPSRMRDNPLWIRVTDCFQNTDINVFKIAREQATKVVEAAKKEQPDLDVSRIDQDAFKLAQQYNDGLTRLRNIKESDLPTQIVPLQATLGEAINIFDRVNSLGTKLTDAELALTHVTGKWPQARREMKSKIEDLSGHGFSFDLNFMTRALTGVVAKRALFEQIHDQPREKLIQGWVQLQKILDYLVTILPTRFYIHSTEDLSTTNALVPLVVYLSLHGSKFPDEASIKHAMHWLYAALMWARYTAQTDQRLEHDVSLIVKNDVPWSDLYDQIVDQRGRIEVKASDLEGRGIQHPLYRIAFIISKAHGAVDWFNGAPLGATHGKAYRLHNHHIFPQAVLYRNGYDPDNHLHRKIVNEIANLAFLTADTNLDLASTPPDIYLPQVERNYPGALTKNFIPLEPALWNIERFQDFLSARRDLIARKINEFMTSLVTEPEAVSTQSVLELIKLGESATLEFKSTLQWDVVQNQLNKDLRFSSLKTIAAFLNSDGGTLIIGVEDDGGIFGLKRDMALVQKQSLDGFEQILTTLVSQHIGAEYARLIKIRFEKVDGEYVCAIDVDEAPTPAFLTGPRGKEFFVRLGNTTRSLDAEETSRYIQMNWE